MESRSSCTITVVVKVNNNSLNFKIKTGAALSILSQEEQNKVFPNATITQTLAKLRSYTGKVMNCWKMTVQVSYGDSYHILTIVAGNVPTLFDRDWLHHLDFDWKMIGLFLYRLCI